MPEAPTTPAAWIVMTPSGAFGHHVSVLMLDSRGAQNPPPPPGTLLTVSGETVRRSLYIEFLISRHLAHSLSSGSHLVRIPARENL
jgi:hypothetical protein